MATTGQMDEIRHRRITDVAREMMASGGVRLTWAERDEIGDEGSDWIRRRLGLSEVTTDEDGVSYAAPSEEEEICEHPRMGHPCGAQAGICQECGAVCDCGDDDEDTNDCPIHGTCEA